MSEEVESAQARRKTRKTIERLLRAAEWSIAKFEEVREEMTGPLAILEAGKRCTDMALKLQEFERNETGETGEQRNVLVRFDWGDDDGEETYQESKACGEGDCIDG